MRLSLVIATYNRAEALIEALRSVVAQDVSAAEWECVVVNNNCSDDTAVRFEAFAAGLHAGKSEVSNLRMVSELRQGLSHARNRGIAESTGEYIAIIDDDERISPDFVRSYIELFDSHPDAASAGGRIIAEYPAGRPAWMSRWTERPIANSLDLGDRIREFPKNRIPGGGNMALRRTMVERYGAFDPALGRRGETLLGGEENDLFARLAAAGERCYYVPTAVMWHIIPPRKTTDEYFRTLCYHVGCTQRLRAQNPARLYVFEAGKWGATFVLAFGFLLAAMFSLRTTFVAKARYLLLMRRQITRGICAK